MEKQESEIVGEKTIAVYRPGEGFRCETKPSMLRRCRGWDYRQPCIYMITLVLADRRSQALGKLKLGASAPSTEQAAPSTEQAARNTGQVISVPANLELPLQAQNRPLQAQNRPLETPGKSFQCRRRREPPVLCRRRQPPDTSPSRRQARRLCASGLISPRTIRK